MRNIPTMLVGPPGVGKTETTISSYDFTEVLLLSSRAEEDIAGIPYRDGKYEERTIPPFVKRLTQASEKGKKVCLFLDEIDKARREVADTLLTLITNPKLFGLPENIDIIAAANPPEWGGGDGVSIPMMNRFCIIEYKPNIEKFCSFIQDKYSSKNPEFIENFTQSILKGRISLLEVVGESYNLRLSSPRSFEYSIMELLSNKSDREKEIRVRGLLTTNGATGIINCFNKAAKDYIPNVLEDISREISEGSNKRTPIRL